MDLKPRIILRRFRRRAPVGAWKRHFITERDRATGYRRVSAV